MAEITLMTVVYGFLAGLLASIGFYFQNKYIPNTEINKIAVVSYMIVGAAIGAVEAYLGIPVTFELVAMLIVANAGIVAAIDIVLTKLFKPTLATFVIKYTGHAFYPEMKLTQNTGEFQVFNTEQTGRCLSVTVHMKALAQAIRPMLASVTWSPGFTVTPSFTEGQSPLTQTFKFTTGRNPDVTSIPVLTVDWKDGSPVEQVPLAFNKEGNPEGKATHTFVFNGS